MNKQYDAIVLGVGAMGSAACFHLARRGLRVLGLEQFEIGHDRGSSFGRSRVIRKAYFEDSRYVPLLHRTYDLWRDLERDAGVQLLNFCGCLNLGPADHECIHGVRRSVEEHQLAHEVLDAAEIHRRWPGLHPAETDIGIYESEAGFLVPEQCVRLFVDRARASGAQIHDRERVRSWSCGDGAASVQTDKGQYDSRWLIVAAGAWLPRLLADPPLPLRVERQVQLWFSPKRREPFTAQRMPAFIHFVGDRAFYGIPMREREGMKVSRHHGGQDATPENLNRNVTPDDEADVRDYLTRHLPEADGPLLDGKVCMYTNTPDDHFIIDRHPKHDNLLVAGGFSGHGFKFAPVVGDILADLITTGATSRPIEHFSLNRFGT